MNTVQFARLASSCELGLPIELGRAAALRAWSTYRAKRRTNWARLANARRRTAAGASGAACSSTSGCCGPGSGRPAAAASCSSQSPTSPASLAMLCSIV